MDKARIEALRNKLQMMARCIFITADEVVAKDIAAGLGAAIDTIDTLAAENEALREGMKGDYDLDAWLAWRKEKDELESLKQQAPHYAIDTAKINDLQKVAIRRIVERAKHAHLTDIHMRINGEWTVEEGDWIKHISLPPEPQGVGGETLCAECSQPSGQTTGPYCVTCSRINSMSATQEKDQ